MYSVGGLLLVMAILGMLTTNRSALHSHENVPIKIILDTDMDTDCDDAGALAVFHNLASHGKIEPLGVSCSVPEQACADYVAAVNTTYGRAELPIGLVSSELWTQNPTAENYQKHRASHGQMGMLYNEAIRTPVEATDAVKLYRRLLADQPDKSVTIVSVGTLTALSALLESEADEISPLTGKELVASRVVRLVSMAVARYPEGKDGFNWRMDFPAAANVINNWPTPVAVQESGADVLTGEKTITALPENHPVAKAYALWLGNWQDGQHKNRSSWDQLSLLYAVDGATDKFEEKDGLKLELIVETGQHRWSNAEGDEERIHVKRVAEPEVMAAYVENWMIGQ